MNLHIWKQSDKKQYEGGHWSPTWTHVYSVLPLSCGSYMEASRNDSLGAQRSDILAWKIPVFKIDGTPYHTTCRAMPVWKPKVTQWLSRQLQDLCWKNAFYSRLVSCEDGFLLCRQVGDSLGPISSEENVDTLISENWDNVMIRNLVTSYSYKLVTWNPPSLNSPLGLEDLQDCSCSR